jgi:predicted PurR-regulated permease PerM
VFDPRDVEPGAGRRLVDGPAAVEAADAAPAVRTVELDWRSVAWALAAFVALLAVTGLVGAAPRAITVVAVGSLLAMALDPLVTRVERALRCHRALAVAAVLTGLFAAAALLIALLAPPAVDQGRRLTGDVDDVVGQLDKLPLVGDRLRQAGTAHKLQKAIEDLPKRLEGSDTPIGGAFVRLADGLLVAGFTVLITLALLLDGPRLVRISCRLVPERRREEAVRLGRLAYDTIGRYIAGSLVVAGIAGIATLAAGLVLRVPLAPLAAVWVALWDLVPQIGGAAGGIPFVLLGLTRGAGTAVACAVFFVLYLQLENHVIQPLVVGRAVKLSPPATMTAALVGVSAGGVVGALLAVPVVAAAKVVYTEVRPATT